MGIVVSVCHAAETYQVGDCALQIQRDGMSLLNEGIRLIDPSIEISGRFHEALKDLYTKVNKGHIVSITEKYLRNVSKTDRKGRTYYAIDAFNQKTLFEEKYIYLYTTLAIYKKLNRILREHDCTTKSLSVEDIYYAPYSAILMSVMMYWSELTGYRGVTYRGVNLLEADINKYFVNKTFVWTQFTSSSTEQSMAFDRNVTFIIYNDQASPYMTPKPVDRFACKKDLMEAIYCPGTEFRVIKVEKNIRNSIGTATITVQTVTRLSTIIIGEYKMHGILLTIIVIFCYPVYFTIGKQVA
jgi:hypothetical protein